MYELDSILIRRLESLGVSEEERAKKITKYEKGAKEYIALMLPNFVLTEGQIELLTDLYIQWQLFAFVELDSLVEDKRTTLSDLISQIQENKRTSQELNTENKKETRNIRVF